MFIEKWNWIFLTSLQKEGLVKYMEEHLNLVVGKFSGEFRHCTAAELWTQCEDELNKLGLAKTPNEWKKVSLKMSFTSIENYLLAFIMCIWLSFLELERR